MKSILSTILSTAVLSVPASAITIALDFSHSSSSFFDGTANGIAAKAAVQAAADDISNAITTSLNPLSNLVYTGTSGSTTVTLTNSLNYTNPDTGASESFTGSLAANEFKIFVGARAIGGTTLGQGGPGGVGIGAGVSGSPGAAQAAADLASASSTAGMTRGAHSISSLGGSFGGAFAGTTYSTSYGPTVGNLWFDNDGSTTWHLNHNSAVASGTSDLYSVALHEILHSLGIGTSDAWESAVSGANWSGPEVIALYGTGIGLIDSGEAHIAENIMSTRLSDGATQEVVMDPNITQGTRKELTALDLAFLRDIGWQTVPEPSSTLLLGLGSFALLIRRKK